MKFASFAVFGLLIQLCNAVCAENKIPLYNEEGLLAQIKTGKALSKAQENEWDYWQLSEAEWHRYLNLKSKSPWSVWESHTTPLALLAFYATSIEEKKRYARIEAELDQWREGAVLEFQSLYNKEREIVFARTKIEIEKKQPLLKNLGVNDRVLFFVNKGDCSARCVAIINPLLASSAHVDIYVIGAREENEIFEWAKSAHIPPERVHLKQITLNYDTGVFSEVSSIPVAIADLPAAYWHRANGYEKIIL